LLEPSGEDDKVHLPLIPVESAKSLQDMVAQGYDELGFSGPTVKAGKDYYDLVSIGLQGIHEPILAMPVRYYTPDGKGHVDAGHLRRQPAGGSGPQGAKGGDETSPSPTYRPGMTTSSIPTDLPSCGTWTPQL